MAYHQLHCTTDRKLRARKSLNHLLTKSQLYFTLLGCQIGLFRVAQAAQKLNLYFWAEAARNRLFLNFYAYLLANFGNIQYYNTFGYFFAIFSLHMHNNGYLRISCQNSDIAIKFSDPNFL